MRQVNPILALAAASASLCWLSYANASFDYLPGGQRINVESPTLAPSDTLPGEMHTLLERPTVASLDSPVREAAPDVERTTLERPTLASIDSSIGDLKPGLGRIVFDRPTLAPMTHTLFCLRYADDCRVVDTVAFGEPGIVLTEARWNDLVSVNEKINHAIVPQKHSDGVLGLEWSLYPAAGDCKDYAATKRHELLTHGWPSRALLLAEVVTKWGEHHLILVVTTMSGDFVLDNLNSEIRSWSKAPYQWVRIQSPNDPKFWSKIHIAPPTAQEGKFAQIQGSRSHR